MYHVSLCWILSQKSWLLVELTHTEITRRSKVLNSKSAQFVTQSYSKDTRIQMLFVWNHHFQMGRYHCLVIITVFTTSFHSLTLKSGFFLHFYVLLHSVMIFVKTVKYSWCVDEIKSMKWSKSNRKNWNKQSGGYFIDQNKMENNTG